MKKTIHMSCRCGPGFVFLLTAVGTILVAVGTIVYASNCPDEAASASPAACYEPSGDEQFCNDMSQSTCGTNVKGLDDINLFPDGKAESFDNRTKTTNERCFTKVDCHYEAGACKKVKGTTDWFRRHKISTHPCYS
jgi:hypothetical protein